jgi:Ca2+-transporting ATPase
MSLVPVLFKLPLVLYPIHIAFLELIIDPTCSVVFESEEEEAGVMQRPPRNLKDPLFNKRTVGISLLQGLIVLIIVGVVYRIGLGAGAGEASVLRANEARALTFTTLVIANLGLILTNRSWSRTIFGTLRSRNAALWWVIGGTLVVLGLVLYVPALRNIFYFGVLSAADLAICFAAGLLSVAWFEGLKLLNSRRKHLTGPG